MTDITVKRYFSSLSHFIVVCSHLVGIKTSTIISSWTQSVKKSQIFRSFSQQQNITMMPNSEASKVPGLNHSKKDISVPTSAHESTEMACQEMPSGENAKKRKKKSKKNKTPDEEQVVPEVEDQVLLKNYREAPGVLKGSNILAIPGYGASK